MKERPILFSGPMVRAILDRRKTQTRRLVTPQPAGGVRATQVVVGKQTSHIDGHGHPIHERFDVGGRLWVREAWMLYESAKHNPWPDLPSRRGPDGFAFYREGFDRSPPHRWTSSIFMPRWASRITLEITEVRLQRLQSISEDDARAEGLHWWSKDGQLRKWGLAKRHESGELDPVEPWAEMARGHADAFERGWDSLNAKRVPWSANPWVWAITFKRIDEAQP